MRNSVENKLRTFYRIVSTLHKKHLNIGNSGDSYPGSVTDFILPVHSTVQQLPDKLCLPLSTQLRHCLLENVANHSQAMEVDRKSNQSSMGQGLKPLKKVSTRWVSARDQYKREKSEKGRSGSGKLHKKPYLYTSFLRFLDVVMDVGETADNLEESASMQTGEDVVEESFEEQPEDLSTQSPTPQPPSTPPPPPPQAPMRSRRRRQLGLSSLSIAAETEVLDQLRRRRDESAEDIFMRSMVQDLKGVHEDDNMNCRVAMMAVLQIFQKGTPKDKSEVALFLERRRQRVGGLLPPSPPPSTRYPAMAPVFHGPYEGSSAMAPHGQSTSGPYTRELFEL
ncbi:uncharacterized protein [Engystomops pustulosus]|uniref:uncharacterized protein n=1 Tax=Engystomops pustulosus TaxID=76066 RepID=UPI003AFA5795